MNRKVIKVPARSAEELQLKPGDGIGLNGYVIEKVSEPFEDDEMRDVMVELTLVERSGD